MNVKKARTRFRGYGVGNLLGIEVPGEEVVIRHPERSEAKSKDPVKLLLRFASGFLDFARNDWKLRCREQTPAHSDMHLSITI